MENHKLVLPEHTNHHGYLFGGNLLKWVDEIAWIAASLDYPGFRFLTVAMDRVEFHQRVPEGSILRFEPLRVREGTTSVAYEVGVHRADAPDPNGEPVFSTCVTFVRIDEAGSKKALAHPGKDPEPPAQTP